MLVNQEAASALAQRALAVDAYGGITSIETLEALRDNTMLETDRKVLDQVILMRKRSEKARLEQLAAGAEVMEKSSLPLSAAMPVFVTFLASEQLIAPPWRTVSLASAYLIGGLLWITCRLLAFKWLKDAKVGIVRLGKVE